MRARGYRLAGATLALLLGSGCTLGTEVGNGAKPRRGGSGGQGGGDDGSDPTRNEKVSHEAPGSSPGPAGDDTASNADSAGGGASTASTGSATTIDPELLGILTTPCASPFADDVASPVQLGVLAATIDPATSVWTLAAPSAAPAALVKKDTTHGDLAISASKPDGSPLTSAFTCDSSRTAPGPDGTATVRTVALSRIGQPTYQVSLAWTLRPRTGSAGPAYILAEITVTRPKGTNDATAVTTATYKNTAP